MKSPNLSLEALQGVARHVAAALRASLATSVTCAVIGSGLFVALPSHAETPAQKSAAAKKRAHHPQVHAAANTKKPVVRRGGEKVAKAAARPASGRVHGVMAANAHAGRGKTVHAVAYRPSRGASHLARRVPPAQAFRMRDSLQDGPALRSTVAYVIDQNTSAPLVDKNSQQVVPIASISKLMTAMVVLDSKAPLSDVILVTDEDRDYEKGSGSRLSVGSRLSREDMLHIALMSSENRAAAALSRYYPGGRPAFVAAMNRKAQDLGMTSTRFEDPTGLNFHNVSTAHDLVKMVEAADKYPLIRQFSTWPSYDVDTGRAWLHYANTNALVHNASWDISLQKTGFINEAGECIVMQTTIHQRPVVMVLLDSVGKYSRVADAQRVRNWLIDTGAIQRLTSADNGHSGT